jgi:hypothetical protein
LPACTALAIRFIRVGIRRQHDGAARRVYAVIGDPSPQPPTVPRHLVSRGQRKAGPVSRTRMGTQGLWSEILRAGRALPAPTRHQADPNELPPRRRIIIIAGQRHDRRWPGAGSNRRPSDFQRASRPATRSPRGSSRLVPCCVTGGGCHRLPSRAPAHQRVRQQPGSTSGTATFARSCLLSTPSTLPDLSPRPA